MPGMVDDGQFMETDGIMTQGLGYGDGIGQSGNVGGAVAPTTGRTSSNGDCDGVASGRIPGMVDNGQATGTGVVEVQVLSPGDGGDITGAGNVGRVAAPTTGTNGHFVGVVEHVSPGMVNDSGPSKEISGIVAPGPGNGGDVREAGNVGWAEASTSGINGHFGGVVDNASSGGCNTDQRGGLMLSGSVNNAGDGLRSYTFSPNDGDGPGRYTSGPNDGDRPSSYTFGHVSPFEDDVNDGDGLRSYTFSPNNVGEGPGRYKSGPKNGDVRTIPRRATWRQKTPSSGCEQSRSGNKSEQQDDWIEDKSDNAAIAGDPSSALQRRDHPRRTIRRPAQYFE